MSDITADPRIPLYHIDGIPVRRCMQSGMCCKKGPCAFGDWDAEARQCRHLIELNKGADWTRYACSIKAEIDALPPEHRADMNPAFGGGCCMPLFNQNREALVREGVRQLGASA